MVHRDVPRHPPGAFGLFVGGQIDAADSPIGIGDGEGGRDVAEVLAEGLQLSSHVPLAEEFVERHRHLPGDLLVVGSGWETVIKLEIRLAGGLRRLALGGDDPADRANSNPAVTLGAAIAGRVEWKAVLPYWIVQVIGGLLAGLAIYVIAKGRAGFDPTGNMAANGYGKHSPGGYTLWAVILAEVLLTAVFLFVILGATEDRAPKGFAGLAIGLTLTLIHLVSIPISNTSVNPARSTGVAFFNGNGAPAQLWVFWLAPLVGAAVAGALYPFLFGPRGTRRTSRSRRRPRNNRGVAYCCRQRIPPRRSPSS